VDLHQSWNSQGTRQDLKKEQWRVSPSFCSLCSQSKKVYPLSSIKLAEEHERNQKFWNRRG
jgi:hypothetical protein